MNSVEIAASILLLTAPGIEGWHGEERNSIARRVNDYGAKLKQQNPKQFGYLATLPMPDVDATLTELKRCYKELDVDGICLHSNFEGSYLGEPGFDSVWEELDRRSAVILIHPTTPAGVKVLEG